MTGRFVAAWASYELLGPGPAGPPDEALKVDRKELGKTFISGVFQHGWLENGALF